MLMLVILLVLYLYSYMRVRKGSGLADVKLIIQLFIVGTVCGMVTLTMQYLMAKCPQDYRQFSDNFQANTVTTWPWIVSSSFVNLSRKKTGLTPTSRHF